MLETIFFSVALGLTSVFLSRVINRTWISACSVYWMAWILALLSANYAEAKGIIPSISDNTLSIICNAHWDAFFGFAIASVIAGPIKKPRVVPLSNWHAALFSVMDKIYKPIMVFLFVIGSLTLLENIQAVGLNALSLMTDLRLHFLENQYSFIDRIASYAFTSATLIAILMGYSDAFRGVRLSRLVLLILVSAIQGLAFGGRGFLAGAIMAYGISFLLATSQIPKQQRHTRDFALKTAVYFFFAFSIFVILGVLRWGVIGEDTGVLDVVLNMGTHWIGLSIPAIDGFVDVMTKRQLGFGAYVFQWPYVQLYHIGLIGTDIRDEAWQAVLLVRDNYGMIGNAPPTIIPFLAADFGIQLMPFYLGVLMGMSHLATIKFRAQGLVRHVIAVLVFLAAFYTIQDTTFLNAANSFILMWTFLLYKYVKFKMKKTEFGAKM